jgi:outer membrane receptor protein involved in Fe transport
VYSYIKLLKNVTFTVGGSGDFFEAEDPTAKDKDQFNPKFGIIWNPWPDTTLRLAAFRTLKRTLVANQTIEPTQVAGFNQFFDDFNTTSAWLYGGAIDQKFSDSIYAGAEFTYRDLDVPFFDTIAGRTRTVDWKEYKPRLYLFWTPHAWLALRAELLWERFERNRDFSDGAREVETYYIPLGINFSHPSGLSASFTGTYINQEGHFEPVTAARTFKQGEDNFWLLDTAISYRFPKRYGFFTLGVTNLADKKFKYFDTDDKNPRIQPDRFFFASATLAIP